MRKIVLSLSLAVTICLVFTYRASASISGLTVSPAIINLQAKANESSISFSVDLTNNSSKFLNVQIKTNDFAAFGQNGQISFYSGNYLSKNNPHGLSYVMNPGINQIGLLPGMNKTIPVTINNVQSLAPGGHYGALVYEVLGPLVPGSNTVSISNNQVLSTLVFLSTFSGGNQQLKLTPPNLSSLYFSVPTSFQFVLANLGNTQSVPYGYVSIEKGNKLVSKSIINRGSGLILPGSSRLFNVNLPNVSMPLFSTSYRLSIAYRPNGSPYFHYYRTNILVIGLIWPIIALLLLSFALIWRIRRSRNSDHSAG